MHEPAGQQIPKREFSSETGPSYLQLLPEAIALAVLISATVFLLQWRYGFNWGDEGWLWYISQRTALGQVPVRDVLSYDPGRYYWSAAIFKLLGRSGFYEQLIANCLFGAIGLAVSYVALGRSGMRRGWRIALLALLGVALGFPRHKIYEQALSLIAAAGIAFVLRSPERSKRWFVYGVVTGLAAFAGKNLGVYLVGAAGLAFLLVKIGRSAAVRWRVLAALCGGVFVGYLPMIFMIVAVRGFGSAFFQSVLLAKHWEWGLPIPFPWRSHIRGLHGLDLLQVRSVSWLCVAVPLAYAFIVWNARRAPNKRAQALSVGASVAGIPFLLQAFYHADFFHIAQSVVPFVLAAGAFSKHLADTGQRSWAAACSAALTLLVLGAWLPMEPVVQHLRAKSRAPQSVEEIEIGGRNFEVAAAQAAVMRTVETTFRNCGARDGGFLEAPFYPGLYAFLNTRAPFWETYYFWPQNEEFQERHIQALIQNRTAVILLNPDASFDKQYWLQIGRTYPKLVDYIVTHYERVLVPLPDGFELYLMPRECRTAG